MSNKETEKRIDKATRTRSLAMTESLKEKTEKEEDEEEDEN